MATLNLSKMKYMSETNLKKFASLIISLSSQVTDIENKCIKPYVDGELYPRDSYVSYNGYIYQATATNQDSAFDETHWDKLSDDFNELTVADIEAMLGLSQEQLETMANLIADTEVRLDKTYSSSKIYQDIQQCLNDSKSYTLKEIAKLNGSSYKVVTSTSEMTSESIIYLLASGNTYDIYIVEEDGTTTKIGDMNIDLSDYYTKAEVDNDFLKKADADGKYATIVTVDGKVDKDKIVTVLDDSVTDEQVASALLTKTELDKTNAKLGDKVNSTEVAHIKRFYSVPDNDWNNAIEEGYYAIPFDSVANTIANRPYDYAIQVHVIKADANDPIFVYQIAYISTSDTRIYIRKQKIDGSWTPWGRICTTSIADVDKTTITPANSNITGTIKYTVKNGICYVSLFNVKSTTNDFGLSISTTMPKPAINCGSAIVTIGTNGNIGFVYIYENTTQLMADFYIADVKGNCSFSYPVAE